jgi:hypothetical protein
VKSFPNEYISEKSGMIVTVEEARLEWYIAINDFADHALFFCNDHSRAFELYSKALELIQDTVVSYPHNMALKSM